MDHANIIISVIVVLCIAAGVTAYGLTNPDNAFSDLAGFTPSADSLASAGNGLGNNTTQATDSNSAGSSSNGQPSSNSGSNVANSGSGSNGGSSGTSSSYQAMVDIVLQLMETPDQELIPEVEVEIQVLVLDQILDQVLQAI